MQPKLKDNPAFTSKPLSFWKKYKENLRNHFYNKPKTIKVKKPLFCNYSLKGLDAKSKEASFATKCPLSKPLLV
ncbi:hypothetical protein VN1195_12560 [Helicobacter pylori]|nr:hypothetical protein VN1195_12560 [Helicobacter pylori]